MDRPRILVDFNEIVAQDVVLLSQTDTRSDSSGNTILLSEGLRVYLYMEDRDENGEPYNLLATGIVERNDAADWSASVPWRCRIDGWE